MIETLADIVLQKANSNAATVAMRHKSSQLSYQELETALRRFAAAACDYGLKRHDRVAVLVGKRFETVTAIFGTARAGGVFVPVNTLLKPQQVAYLLQDCNAKILVTTGSRLTELWPALQTCSELRHVIVIDPLADAPSSDSITVHPWEEIEAAEPAAAGRRSIASDMAAIMYTSGSTGRPKGVVLSHQNLTIGAASVASYIDNGPDDVILAALPLSFDAGFSQLTTAFHAGACVVLHDYLLPRDLVKMIEKESVTGITAVPPLWMQLAEQSWEGINTDCVRYFANTGGKMPQATLKRLRQIFPAASPYLMYGLTEAFRSTYLPPAEADRRPDSIGKAIPNVEVMVVNADGGLCGPGEPGELVHRGPLVAMGYWNDPERTALRFRPAPGQPAELPLGEYAVYSGDSVRMDEDGYLYFVGRLDDMIKTSGYRVSPAEIEEVVYDSDLVAEVAALGITHERLGQGIVLIAKAKDGKTEPTDELLQWMRPRVANYMIPQAVLWRAHLPRNANGKLDRKTMATELADYFGDV